MRSQPPSRIVAITDADDPRIEAYRDVKDRDLHRRHDGFMAEGDVVLSVFVRSRLQTILSVLIAEHRVPRMADLLACIPPETPIYAAPQDVLDAIAGFALHRGILALGQRPPPVPISNFMERIGGKGPLLMLQGIANHDNMGGIFRNAAAFGAAGVLLDPTCCDPLYRKAIRVSVGGVLEVPFARLAPQDDPIAVLEGSGYTPLALSPKGAVELSDMTVPPRPAILLGGEGPGLGADLLARCCTVRLTMAGSFDSLNVATTSGIALYHMAQHRRRLVGG